MVVVIFSIIHLAEKVQLTKYEIPVDSEIDIVTPQLLQKMVKANNIRGKLFVVLLGDRVYLGAKLSDGFQAFRLT